VSEEQYYSFDGAGLRGRVQSSPAAVIRIDLFGTDQRRVLSQQAAKDSDVTLLAGFKEGSGTTAVAAVDFSLQCTPT
jgi:hypothetical protein